MFGLISEKAVPQKAAFFMQKNCSINEAVLNYKLKN
ncbi:hypothetical protein H4V97_001691 [Flavobacterium sp. CG_23.5]|jgi:hypothetical protein|nr:hypothetical protein [Flavobacterium sp. CG_9.10]MBP2283373.1 hypothetical protein [Flavobacterium sp. CG_23.5]